MDVYRGPASGAVRMIETIDPPGKGPDGITHRLGHLLFYPRDRRIAHDLYIVASRRLRVKLDAESVARVMTAARSGNRDYELPEL